MAHPPAERPNMPGYGLDDPKYKFTPLTLAWVGEKMAASRNYWIGTTRSDGRPHAAPVWGVWMDDRLLFSTGDRSQKARNISRSPAVVAHLESGDDVVIVEGHAVAVTDAGTRTRFDVAYEEKYDFNPGAAADPNSLVYRVEPRTIMAWLEKDFPATASRWRFA
jgi:PPOX class probable F420-dependent enzyme